MFFDIKLVHVLAIMGFLTFAMTSSTQAIIITDGGGAVLFKDDFESSPQVSTGTEDPPLDADPVAQIGTWNITEDLPEQGQVLNTSNPGAFEGDNYFQVSRAPQGPFIELDGVFNEIAVGGSLNISMMRLFSTDFAISSGVREHIKVVGEDGISQRVRMFVSYLSTESKARVWCETPSGEEFTGLTFDMDKWVRIDMAVDLDTETYGLTVSDKNNSNSVSDIPFYTSGNDAALFRINPSYSGEISCFDAVGPWPLPFPGDANDDGFVNALDANALAVNWLKPTDATWEEGDFNQDHAVDDLDAAILAANWGYSGGVSSVPEPAVTVMLGSVITMLLFTIYRRWR